MDLMFQRMNAAMRVKKLDPMDLKLLPSSKVTRLKTTKVSNRNHILTTDRPIYGPGSKGNTTTTTTESFLILSTPLPTKPTKPTRPPKPAKRPETAAAVAGPGEEEVEEELSKVTLKILDIRKRDKILNWFFFIRSVAGFSACPP